MLSVVAFNSQVTRISHPAMPKVVNENILLSRSHRYLNEFKSTSWSVRNCSDIQKKLHIECDAATQKNESIEINNSTIFAKKHKDKRIKRTLNHDLACPAKLNNLRTAIPEVKIILNREILDQVNRNEVDINTQDKDNRTALMVAVLLGVGIKEISRLLENGAEINYLDREGNTALIFAIMAKENAVIEVLLKVGANVNLGGNMAFTPLMLAVMYNDPQLIDKLAARGIKPDLKNDDEETALTLAINNGASRKVIESLLRLGVGVNVPGKNGLMPVILAAGNGNKMYLNKILSFGADIDAVDNNGWTALMRTVACGNQIIMKYLVARGAAVNVRDTHNTTALSLALSRGHKMMASILRSAGADEGHQAIRHQRPLLFSPKTAPTPYTTKAPSTTMKPADMMINNTNLPVADVMSVNCHKPVKPACLNSGNIRISQQPGIIIYYIMMLFYSARKYLFH